MKITFLGTGTSQGVPVIGCTCETCSSVYSIDQRLRSSVLIEVGGLHILIDIGPDFRQQMLTHQVQKIDAVLLTHEHNDHIAGVDDIRPFNFKQEAKIPFYALSRTIEDLKIKYAYIFAADPYPGAPGIVCHNISPNFPFKIGNQLIAKPIHVMHGTLPILGFRIFDFAYITDASQLDEDALQSLKDLKVLVINALQYKKHYSHFNFDEAVAMAKIIGAETTYLTHISHHLGLYHDIVEKCPPNIFPGFDGLVVEC
jgi:phosphoribosyl 1,2-cyclic phosphate phosphodiesterase